MEVRLELDASLVDELDEEAQLQGFADRAAYLRWIVTHRPMSELATAEAPAVASRVSALEERLQVVERQLDLDDTADPDADLGDGSASTATDDLAAAGSDADDGEDFGSDESFESAVTDAAADDPVDDEEPAPPPEEPEDAAADDDIAEAIGDVSLEDEEADHADAED
jgi:hypothetical protein